MLVLLEARSVLWQDGLLLLGEEEEEALEEGTTTASPGEPQPRDEAAMMPSTPGI